MGTPFTATTTIRRAQPASLRIAMASLLFVLIAAGVLFQPGFPDLRHVGPLPFVLLGLFGLAVGRQRSERVALEASPEGLRIGDTLLPRAKLATAVLRREHERSFVLLSGSGPSIDVEVHSEEEADELCRALGLDAASATADFTIASNAPQRSLLSAAVFAMLIAGLVLTRIHGRMSVRVLALAVFVLFSLRGLARQAKLRVGADGILIPEGIASKRFISHDEITSVRAEGASIQIARKDGEPIDLSVGPATRKNRRQLTRQAESIVWRIEKAREAYRALAGDAPHAALVLARGEKTAREWLRQLRAVGAGASATFRSAEITREQLLRIVESTTAAATERIAAIVALHDGLTDEEKPRIRIAADRCAEPALGEAMVRVALAPSEEELETALEEHARRVNADG